MKKYYFLLLSSLLVLVPNVLLGATLDNPLGTTNIREVIARIIQSILGVTGSLALLMFIYGGFLFLISAGEAERVKKGKEVMKWAILGLVVIIGAYMIVSTIVTALETGTVG
ncbi:hypothetical protein COV05_04825 [Candidatus Uhrbacteria bacterium CG10_big_fil_rev_8_21_14_0_10_48_16]|uniref:TrbC/VIRB2 family protein n=1 Tax=Candidatus Uhrbacteria bacterium CG10_big_fil_rev_8_21_14_0_10_48_16 TaxID=1975038 RepID=A0A2M8LG26_9BACT|nr:MAG: hypothetical protein COV05_04825 [Candidatus Uhrbacteria bacterium CG10_big_fil_rev_8_21_14_0_10_48_16]